MKKFLDIFISFFKSFFKLKNWIKPYKKDVIIYDSARTEIIEKYFNKKNYYILNVRYKNNVSINFYIIFKLIVKFKLSTRNYRNEIIKEISPKFIISMIDNNWGFYRLKKDFPNIKFILIQFAWRQQIKEIIPKEFLKKDKIKDNKLDYFIIFNESLKKEFSKYIKANYLTLGSFTSNSFNINKKNFKYKYLLIGQNTESNLKKKRDFDHTLGDYLAPDHEFYKIISKFILREKNDILNILGKSIDDKDNAIEFYNNLLGTNKFHYINRKGYSYEILDKSEIIIGTTSTLLYEGLSRGKRVGIFSHKSKNSKFRNTKFGWPATKQSKGFFWTNSLENKEIRRVINNICDVEENKWKKIIKNEFGDILKYDQGNKKFVKFAKKIKMPIRIQ